MSCKGRNINESPAPNQKGGKASKAVKSPKASKPVKSKNPRKSKKIEMKDEDQKSAEIASEVAEKKTE